MKTGKAVGESLCAKYCQSNSKHLKNDVFPPTFDRPAYYLQGSW